MKRVPWPAALLLAVAGGAAAACPDDALDRQIDTQIDTLAREQGAQVAETVGRIEGAGRRMLALRSYVRVSASIANRWSWTQDQIEAYRQSDEYQALLAEIEKIRARFEADNPGYQLYANTEVRSLDLQVERWNGNATIGRIADDLESAACAKLEKDKAPPVKGLKDFLVAWIPEEPAPLAAPGLSLHGRARAIDFQVHQGNKVIAGADTSDIKDLWVGQGWGRKLASAVATASTRFAGPLKMPNEPWHFEYQPKE